MSCVNTIMATEVRVFVLRHLGLLETAGASQNKSVATILVSIGNWKCFLLVKKKEFNYFTRIVYSAKKLPTQLPQCLTRIQIVFRRGSVPDPARGAYDAPTNPLVGWGGGYPVPIPHTLDAFGV